MLHLFLELTTLLFFLLLIGDAHRRRGRLGLWMLAAMMGLGFIRENFVTLSNWLYGFADLHLMFGVAPLIASIIWPYSIYVAVCWSERVGRWRLGGPMPARALALITLFMIALVGFYEPVLHRVGMARWHEGTRMAGGVPWIALIGYPTLAVPFVGLFNVSWRRLEGWSRRAALVLGSVALAVTHAWGLQTLKEALGW